MLLDYSSYRATRTATKSNGNELQNDILAQIRLVLATEALDLEESECVDIDNEFVTDALAELYQLDILSVSLGIGEGDLLVYIGFADEVSQSGRSMMVSTIIKNFKGVRE